MSQSDQMQADMNDSPVRPRLHQFHHRSGVDERRHSKVSALIFIFTCDAQSLHVKCGTLHQCFCTDGKWKHWVSHDAWRHLLSFKTNRTQSESKKHRTLRGLDTCVELIACLIFHFSECRNTAGPCSDLLKRHMKLCDACGEAQLPGFSTVGSRTQHTRGKNWVGVTFITSHHQLQLGEWKF